MASSPAERLLHRYVPGAQLQINWSGQRQKTWVHVQDDASITVSWDPSKGLTTLLHEIGHYRLRHWGRAQLERELVAPTAAIVMAEVAAWLWAEKAARRHRIVFDYGEAERAFGTYSRQVRIAWRHRT